MPTTLSSSPSPAAPQKSRGSYIAFLIFIAILGAFSSLVNDMYLPTMPAMRREFHCSTSMTQMGLTMVMLGLGIGSVIWGSLSDRYGRKPMLLYSLGLFAVATLVSIFSDSIYFFIICRLFQGIGAGGGMVLSYSIPTDLYQGRQLAKVMALVGAINGIAPAASPIVGGAMADSVGWRGIFVLLLVIGVGMFFWSIKRPESLAPDKRIQGKGLKEYLKPYGMLFRNGRFMIYVLIKAIGIGMLYGYISASPFIIQDRYGYTAGEFGLILGANAIAIAVGSTLVMKFKVLKRGLETGTVIMSVAAIGLAVIWIMGKGLLWFEIMAVPMLLGSGMLFSSANSLGMQVGRADAGTASAILNVVKYIFAAVVSPLVGLGDIMRSSGIAFIIIAAIALGLTLLAIRLKPLASMVKQ